MIGGKVLKTTKYILKTGLLKGAIFLVAGVVISIGWWVIDKITPAAKRKVEDIKNEWKTGRFKNHPGAKRNNGSAERKSGNQHGEI